jgi:hypothetical protein
MPGAGRSFCVGTAGKEFGTLRFPPNRTLDMRKFSLAGLRGHMMFWSVTVALMVIDDAAMLAMIFS